MGSIVRRLLCQAGFLLFQLDYCFVCTAENSDQRVTALTAMDITQTDQENSIVDVERHLVKEMPGLLESASDLPFIVAWRRGNFTSHSTRTFVP